MKNGRNNWWNKVWTRNFFVSVIRTIRPFAVVFFLFFSNATLAQEFKQFFYPDGSVSSEGTMVNGQPDGYWKSYYQDGTLKSVGKRTNFLLDSIWTFYDEQGRLQKEISYFESRKNGYYKEYALADSVIYLSMRVLYVNDQKQGIEEYFSPQGTIVKTIPYTDNKKEGFSYEYDDSTVISITIYENNNLLSSQSVNRTNAKGQKVGQHISFYPNGAIKTEANYSDGKLNGMYKLYDQHEQLIQVGNYENDSLIYSSSTMAEFEDPFEKKSYYSDSTLKYKGAYRDKTPIGVHRHYDKNGNVTSGELYDIGGTLVGQGITLENGDKSGQWIFFYPTGKKESEGLFEKGQKEGLWKYYYPDGTLKQTGYFRHDKFNGLWEFYSESGDLLTKEEYENGQRNGLSVEYDDEGNKIMEGMYENDLKQGVWTIKIGSLVTTGTYQYGEKIDVWKSTYVGGGKAFKGNYVAGRAQGKHFYYYKNGQVEHEEQWKNGQAVKTWNYYQENGTLKYAIYYKNGKETKVETPVK